ncbi:LruC domain-containing protein [bacterium]|nr:LruC domain-containing protein [bacterium]
MFRLRNLPWGALLLALALALASCGGYHGAPINVPDNPDTGGSTGLNLRYRAGLQASHSASSLSQAAPLPPGAQAQVSFRPLRSAAALAPGEQYKLLWLAISAHGEAPVAGKAGGPFYGGDLVDLHCCYEAAAGTLLDRYWVVAGAGLSYVERAVEHEQSGEYTAVFTYQLPFSMNENEAIELPADFFSLDFSLTETETAEPVLYPQGSDAGMAQMVWEDVRDGGGDYDFNDFVASLRAEELRDKQGRLVQINMRVKALARGAGYGSDWQLNLAAAFPGSNIYATVDQYYDNGDKVYTNDERHFDQRFWTSSDGSSLPVFAPTADALPSNPGGWGANVKPGNSPVEGDYAMVSLTFDPPLAQGSYTPLPYKPELLVIPAKGEPYSLGLWRKPGDAVDSQGVPLGFIVPDTFAWPLEGESIFNVYSGFGDWVEWINNPSGPEPSPAWYNTAPKGKHFDPDTLKDEPGDDDPGDDNPGDDDPGDDDPGDDDPGDDDPGDDDPGDDDPGDDDPGDDDPGDDDPGDDDPGDDDPGDHDEGSGGDI